MTDIVERLINWVTDWDGSQMKDGEPPRDGLHCDILREAAAEIERLRAEIAIATNTWSDDHGTVWAPATAWAYAQVCETRDKWRAEAEKLRAERDAGWSIGNRAKKKIGYRFNGEVRSVFTTRTGETRLVVELIGDNGGGLLHIFNPNQMEKSHD